MATIIMETLGVSNVMTPTTKATDWRVGTVTHIRPEASGLRSYTFSFDSAVKHFAGQHYEIRLTAADGYQATRLYSAAMPANGSSNTLQLTIAIMPRGEVSSYIFNRVKTGSQLEIRGPLGRYFILEPEETHPILLVGGGTGVVPLRAMRIEHQQCCSNVPMKLLYSVKTYQDMAYKYELFPPLGDPARDVAMTFTAESPKGWDGYSRRIDASMLREVLTTFQSHPYVYVCGPTQMVESVSQQLVKLGLAPSTIKVERFGSTI
jgi:ferredoxin-NADP reductase